MCCTGSKAFKRRPVHRVAVAINCNFLLLLKSFIAYMLMCKARLKTKFKCECVTMCSLVTSLFSSDFIKRKQTSINSVLNLVNNYLQVYSIHTAFGF